MRRWCPAAGVARARDRHPAAAGRGSRLGGRSAAAQFSADANIPKLEAILAEAAGRAYASPAARKPTRRCPGSCRLSSLGRLPLSGRMRHAADQHPQATVELCFTERLSEHGRMGEALVDFTVPRGDECEWHRLRLEPLGDRVYGFAVRQLDVEQRCIARGGFDQREGIGNLRGRAEYLAPVPADGVLHLQSDESVVLDDEDGERLRTRAHEPPPQAAHVLTDPPTTWPAGRSCF